MKTMKNLYVITTKTLPHVHFQRGASLLEGIAYLGIAAIVILGAVSLLSGAFSSAQTNGAMEEVTAIRTGVRKLFMGQPSGYTNASLNTNLIAAKVIPSSLATAGGVITNTWGGAVTITGATSTFDVSYTNVPQDICINMVTSSSGWSQVQVGAAAARPTSPPITPAQATTDCAGVTANTIVWTSN
jgi:PilS N terminal